MTADQIRAAATALGRLGAAKGGKARAAKMPPDERSRQARHAVGVRWKRAKSRPNAIRCPTPD